MTSPTRILTLDNGVVRGLSSLFILRELVRHIEIERFSETSGREPSKTSEPRSAVKPCDIFDIICGTGTGGLIALMLGRLEMTVDEALEKYIEVAKAIFSPIPKVSRAKIDRDRLEKIFVRNSPLNLDAKTTFHHNSSSCTTVVLSTNPSDSNSVVPIRSDKEEIATIWQVAVATMATPPSFCNPIEEALKQAKEIRGPLVQCIVSVGTGSAYGINPKTNVKPAKIARSIFDMKWSTHGPRLKVAKQCAIVIMRSEDVHWTFRKDCGDSIGAIYYRLSVTKMMHKTDLEEWNRLKEVGAETQEYMQQPEQRREVEEIVRLLLWNETTGGDTHELGS